MQKAACSARSGPMREALVLRDATSVRMTAQLQRIPEGRHDSRSVSPGDSSAGTLCEPEIRNRDRKTLE